MLPIYLGSLALGAVLIGASIMFGDADGDLDADFDAEADFDPGGFAGGLDPEAEALLVLKDPGEAVSGAGSWLPFLSLRFWTFALAAFGASGSLLYAMGVSGLIGILASSVMGVAIGTGASWVFRQLQLTQVSGNVGMFDVQGKEATILLPVGPEKMGKVRVLLDGQMVDLPATTQADETIERNKKALVVHVEDGVAQITPVPFGYNTVSKEN